MSVLVAYRADAVGPVVKRLVKENEALTGVQEDDIDFTKLVSPRVVQQPAPPDPLLAKWAEATHVAEDFANTNPSRTQVARDGISQLIRVLQEASAATTVPAPVAPAAPRTEPNVLIRWGSRREGNADIVINSAAAVLTARDKRESRRLLAGICPTTWIRSAEVRTPCVVRPRRHHAGKKFFVCNTPTEIERAIAKCGPGWYASELIDKAAEYRVFILQGRVIRVSAKTQAEDGGIAWNVGVGATAKGLARSKWPLPVLNKALDAARRLGLDWTAVDVCVGKNGNVYVLEANTAPGLASGTPALEQIAWAFAWIPKNDKPTAVNQATATDWKDYLHPSLLESAED